MPRLLGIQTLLGGPQTLGLVTSKFARVAVASVLLISVAFLWRGSFSTQKIDDVSSHLDLKPHNNASVRTGNGRLHLLVPATSSNPDLCKVLLSAQILGYPTPVLINYGDEENIDPYVQHLGKVKGILNYLQRLETSDDFAEDLVLIIDGYDVWFQLRPDVLLKRFYAVNDDADARALETYGEEPVKIFDIHHNVIFGSDKLCWPVDFSRPACWAVPESPLSPTAFGPNFGYEDREKNEAKWLNSGTVIGRASDLRDIFKATLEAIHTNHTTDSDQFYFANVFGEQEYARIRRKPDLLEHLKNRSYVDAEDPFLGEQVRLEPDVDYKKTEYHIGLDYTSTLFQALAYWKQHLVWTRVVDSWEPANATRFADTSRAMRLPGDIQRSPSPFEPFKYGHDSLGHPDWPEVNLAYNVITKEFPVLLHITGNPSEKYFRAWWWQKLWFQAEAEQLRLASQMIDQRAISPDLIDGLHWFNAEMRGAEDILAGGKGGAFTDRRGWLSWKQVCGDYEEEIYRVPDDGWFHPRPQLQTPSKE